MTASFRPLKALLMTLGCLYLVLVTSVQAHAADVDEVPVTSMGFGGSPAEAIRDGIVNAVAQINGEAVAASMQLKENSKTMMSTDGQASREMSREMQESISRKTRGVVVSWQVLSQEKTDAGDYSAKVSARIARLSRSAQLSRMKLTVVWSKGGDEGLSVQLIESLVRQFTSSRKFALIDRKNNAAIQDQLSRISQGEGRVADQVRLTGAEVPDFLVIVHVTNQKKSGTKSYAYGNLEIVDYSSRQVKFSERKLMVLDSTKTGSVPIRMNVLAKSLSRAVIESVYPPTVVAVSEQDFTIGQGKDFFSKGDEVLVFEMGKSLKDPATNEFLSRERNEVAKAIVTYSDARITKAKLNDANTFNPRLVAQGAYVVTRTGMNVVDDDVPASTNNSTKKSKSVSDLLDD